MKFKIEATMGNGSKQIHTVAAKSANAAVEKLANKLLDMDEMPASFELAKE
ncbi:MAG: hypothetical protein WC110_09745 [Bacteroidales bacterium]